MAYMECLGNCNQRVWCAPAKNDALRFMFGSIRLTATRRESAGEGRDMCPIDLLPLVVATVAVNILHW